MVTCLAPIEPIFRGVGGALKRGYSTRVETGQEGPAAAKRAAGSKAEIQFLS